MRTTAVQKSNKKNYMMHKLIKSDSKDIYIVAKYFDLKCKCWSFYLSKDPENDHGFHKNTKQHNCFQH